MLLRALIGLALLAAAAGCDSNVEPFVPGEEPVVPDLSRLFPPEPPGGTSPTRPVALPAAPAGARAPVRGEPVRGTVAVAPELAARVPGEAVLFVIARDPAGGPPLAAKRIDSPDFPHPFALGPEDRMTEATPFDGPFDLSARLDADGNATTRSPGDMQGAATAPASPGDADVRIVLDQVF